MSNHRPPWYSFEQRVFTSQHRYVGHVENDSSTGCLLTECCRLYIVTRTQQKWLSALSLCFITPKDKHCSEPKQTDKVENNLCGHFSKSKFCVQKLSWQGHWVSHYTHSNVKHKNTPEEDSRFSNMLNPNHPHHVSELTSRNCTQVRVYYAIDKHL